MSGDTIWVGCGSLIHSESLNNQQALAQSQWISRQCLDPYVSISFWNKFHVPAEERFGLGSSERGIIWARCGCSVIQTNTCEVKNTATVSSKWCSYSKPNTTVDAACKASGMKYAWSVLCIYRSSTSMWHKWKWQQRRRRRFLKLGLNGEPMCTVPWFCVHVAVLLMSHHPYL